MYTLLECFVILGLVLVLGAAIFLAVTLVVLIDAGVKAVVTRPRPLASPAAIKLRENLEASPLAQAVGQGD
jgi:hypothetical protein